MKHHKTDIPIKVLKENTDIFNNSLSNSFNNSIKLSTFPEIPKHSDITPLYKKGKKMSKETTDQSAFFQIYQKYLKNTCLNKCRNFLRICFRNINVGFRRVSVPSNVFWQC